MKQIYSEASLSLSLFLNNLHLNPEPHLRAACAAFQRWHALNLNVEFMVHGSLHRIMMYTQEGSMFYMTWSRVCFNDSPVLYPIFDVSAPFKHTH